ncbi:PREDICTED: serine/arginine repetitive matrix protein 3-like, partial [Chinchilla lanigera]|uniref:serine/arginine repetitive matrix protein 3-like n=1 Tax=Chinchilla lanigera TaxID=34839 RepID=UPI00069794E3
LQQHVLARALQRLHGLVVGGLAQVRAVHRQDGVAQQQRPALVGCQPREDLGDGNRHPVLPAALDADPQAPRLLLYHPHPAHRRRRARLPRRAPRRRGGTRGPQASARAPGQRVAGAAAVRKAVEGGRRRPQGGLGFGRRGVAGQGQALPAQLRYHSDPALPQEQLHQPRFGGPRPHRHGRPRSRRRSRRSYPHSSQTASALPPSRPRGRAPPLPHGDLLFMRATPTFRRGGERPARPLPGGEEVVRSLAAHRTWVAPARQGSPLTLSPGWCPAGSRTGPQTPDLYYGPGKQKQHGKILPLKMIGCCLPMLVREIFTQSTIQMLIFLGPGI